MAVYEATVRITRRYLNKKSKWWIIDNLLREEHDATGGFHMEFTKAVLIDMAMKKLDAIPVEPARPRSEGAQKEGDV